MPHPCLRSVLSVVAIIFVFVDCQSLRAGETNNDAKGIEFFEQHIRPLLIEHCYECHAGDEDNGNLKLDSRAATFRGGDSGVVLKPGKPDESLLIEAVRYSNRDFQMPPSGKLKNSEIAAFEKWVALGAPDPRVENASDQTSAPAPTGMSIENGKEFWSFRRIEKPSIPEFPNNNWIQTPIDAIVLQQLLQHELSPAPPAERGTWIRRVTQNLIGLPPTPEQVDAFVNDEFPDAKDKVIERLLASPDYGVRWGRHWLDVARYADSNGLDENLAFGNAWRYRDYVVNSFNENKPFDRFLIEQIAGDLIPAANEESRIATGFLALGAKVLAEPDREKLTMDTVDEQIDTVGKAFMGLTLGCVRCHDHKFDPINQTDYYALATIFKNTKSFADSRTGAIKHWYEYSFADDDELARLKEVEAKIAAAKKEATNFKNSEIGKLRTDARNHAADYLAAATQFKPSATLGEVIAIAKPLGLHPRILHHCRLHVHYGADDPLFSQWHELTRKHEPQDVADAVKTHFQSLFERMESALLQARKDAKKIEDPDLEIARQAVYDNTGFLAVPPKPEFAFDEATLKKYYELETTARLIESGAADESSAMGVADGDVKTSLAIHIRGSHLNLGDPIQREFPAVMRRGEVRPIWPINSSGRLELARWMASTQHPLTARVYVNRVWRWHFGRGLVASTENFGALGSRPSNHALLDFLAYQFMQNGWSTKDLHRMILRSSTYAMSILADEKTLAADPENQWLSRFSTQRLEAEQIRDSILAVSGRLETNHGGKSVPLRNRQFVFNHTSVDHTKYDSLRRAIYLPVIRNNVYTLFEQFDFPDPTMPTGDRNSTVVAPQSLWMMNSDLVIDSSEQLAKNLIHRFGSDSQRLDWLYRITLSRRPSEAEVVRANEFLGDDPTHRDWALLCHSILAGNEFLHLR